MERIIPNQDEQDAIHPLTVFKQAWGACWKNLGKLSAIYLIFNLPVLIISLSPAVRSIPQDKLSLAGGAWFLFLIVISSWGQIALLLGAGKAVDSEDYSIVHGIKQARDFLVKYLVLAFTVIVLIMSIIILAGIAVALVMALINKMLAALICFILLIALVASLVFFLLRWSLVAPVCVFQDTWPAPALRGSFALIKEHINPVVGIYGLIGLVYLVCFTPLIIAELFSGSTVNADPSASLGTTIYIILINMALVPFWTVITVMLYKKLKEVLGAHVYA